MTAVPVLVAASGAAWERSVLELLDGRRDVMLHKRCVDLADLLATATTGLAGAAVLDTAVPGLDGDSISVLTRAGLGVVVVAAPHELTDTGWLGRLGVEHVVSSDELGGLVDALRAAAGNVQVESRPRVPVDMDPVREDGDVLAVWGPAGAPGRTTMAVGLAAELARRHRSVALVDADPYGGAVAQHLGVLDEVSGLLAAARMANVGRLDLERLASLCREVAPDLRVLTGLPRPDRWVEVRPQAFEDLLRAARRLVGHVVVDVGFSLEQEPPDPFTASAAQRNGMTLSALALADEVLVVGAADPVGLSRLARGLVELHELLPDSRPRIVVNRARASLGWGEREIRAMVEGFVTPAGVHFVPEDRIGADRALMAGRSLVESGDSALRRAVSSLADAALGESAHTGPRGRALRGRLSVRPRRGGRAR